MASVDRGYVRDMPAPPRGTRVAVAAVLLVALSLGFGGVVAYDALGIEGIGLLIGAIVAGLASAVVLRVVFGLAAGTIGRLRGLVVTFLRGTSGRGGYERLLSTRSIGVASGCGFGLLIALTALSGKGGYGLENQMQFSDFGGSAAGGLAVVPVQMLARVAVDGATVLGGVVATVAVVAVVYRGTVVGSAYAVAAVRKAVDHLR
jgi:hypothetical protein